MAKFIRKRERQRQTQIPTCNNISGAGRRPKYRVPPSVRNSKEAWEGVVSLSGFFYEHQCSRYNAFNDVVDLTGIGWYPGLYERENRTPADSTIIQ